PFPAFSPDLNPIENAWHILKSCLHKHWPHTEDKHWEALSEEWEGIDQSSLDHLVDSMPELVAAMVKAQRTHTKW
ncbi:transposable element Tcb1 transposase, partial [Tuber magnatum]